LDPPCDAGSASHRRTAGRVDPGDDPRPSIRIKWKKAYYGVPERGWIIEIVAYDVPVNVVFFGGAEFDLPPPLGTTGRERYVKVTTLEEANGPEMHKWVEQAARVPGWT
jgi:hypothetical protein